MDHEDAKSEFKLYASQLWELIGSGAPTLLSTEKSCCYIPASKLAPKKFELTLSIEERAQQSSTHTTVLSVHSAPGAPLCDILFFYTVLYSILLLPLPAEPAISGKLFYWLALYKTGL